MSMISVREKTMNTLRRRIASSWNERTSWGVVTFAIPPRAIQPYRVGSSNDKLMQFSSYTSFSGNTPQE